jgi:hypothetical protein
MFTERDRCQDSWPIVSMKETNTPNLVICYSYYTKPIIIIMIKSRSLKGERHVARIEEMRNARKFLVSTHERKGALCYKPESREFDSR